MVFLKNKNEYITLSHPIYVLKIVIDTTLLLLFFLVASFVLESIIPSLIVTPIIALLFFNHGRRRAPHLFRLIRINDTGIKVSKTMIRWTDIQSITANNDSLMYKYNLLKTIEYPLGLMLEIKSNTNQKIIIKATPALLNMIDRRCTDSQKEQLDSNPYYSATENLKLSIMWPTAIFTLVNIIVGLFEFQYLKYSIIICLLAMFYYRSLLEYYRFKY